MPQCYDPSDLSKPVTEQPTIDPSKSTKFRQDTKIVGTFPNSVATLNIERVVSYQICMVLLLVAHATLYTRCE